MNNMQVISHQPPIYFLTSPNSQRSGHFDEKTYGFPCDPACPQQDLSPFSWLSPPANLLHNSGVTAKRLSSVITLVMYLLHMERFIKTDDLTIRTHQKQENQNLNIEIDGFFMKNKDW